MIKKFIYYGVFIVAVAIIVLLAAGSSVSGNLMGNIPVENVTVPSNSFTYALINATGAQTAIVSVIASSTVNIYVFNASNFDLWISHMTGNASANGLEYAQAIYNNASQFIFANTLMMAPANVSLALSNGGLYNRSAYVVVDNTNGSPSSIKTVRARVVYVVLNSATTKKFRSLADRQLYIGTASVLMFLAGVILVIYGAMKKEVQAPAGQVPTGKKEASKEYIDSLYKNVIKRKRGERNTK